MLSIFILILKIIGMVLLILLCLLLLILLTVLFVPVRYRIYVEHGELLRIEGTVSWLLHLLHARISMRDKTPHIRVRIFGKIIYDNLRVRTPKTKRYKKRDVKKGDRRKSVSSESAESSVDNNTELPIKIITPSEFVEPIREEIWEPIKNDETPEIIKKYSKLQTFLNKIKNLCKNFKIKIITFFKGIKDRIKKWIETSVHIKRKIDLIIKFIKDEINQQVFKLTYSSLKKLLKHILPTKLRSRMVFGTGDPCTTGQALGVIGILYSFYGDKIQITPDFENKRFEGKHDARGRIRLITILIIVTKLILDKRFKLFRRNMKILKEAL